MIMNQMHLNAQKTNICTFSQNTQNHIKDSEKPDKIKRLYNNYEACKNCKSRNKRFNRQTNTTKPSQNTVHKMQKANEPKKWKNKNIKTNTPKDQALKDHLEYIKEQSPYRKRSSYRNGKNRRKNKLWMHQHYNLITITQHKTRNKKYK